MAHILVFGDSIAYGAWDKEGGWVQRLREFVDEKALGDGKDPEYMVYNVGISGNTTELILNRFEPELKRRLDVDENIIIIAIGTNDSSILDETKEFWVPCEKFKLNMEKLIKISKKYSNKIVLVGLTLVEELKTSPYRGGIDIHYKNENMQKYNEIIKFLSKENKVYFVDVMNEWNKLDYPKLLYDGVHPNSEGHKKIFQVVRDFLLEKDLI